MIDLDKIIDGLFGETQINAQEFLDKELPNHTILSSIDTKTNERVFVISGPIINGKIVNEKIKVKK